MRLELINTGTELLPGSTIITFCVAVCFKSPRVTAASQKPL